jgi:hypothetical protein
MIESGKKEDRYKRRNHGGYRGFHFFSLTIELIVMNEKLISACYKRCK